MSNTVEILVLAFCALLASFIAGSAIVVGYYAFGALILTFALYNIYRVYEAVEKLF